MAFIYSLQAPLRANSLLKHDAVAPSDVMGFLLVLVWVNLAGAGAYGYQTEDYLIHNARLKDLIEYPWPIRYGDNQNLVYYFGYFFGPMDVVNVMVLGSASASLHESLAQALQQTDFLDFRTSQSLGFFVARNNPGYA